MHSHSVAWRHGTAKILAIVSMNILKGHTVHLQINKTLSLSALKIWYTGLPSNSMPHVNVNMEHYVSTLLLAVLQATLDEVTVTIHNHVADCAWKECVNLSGFSNIPLL